MSSWAAVLPALVLASAGEATAKPSSTPIDRVAERVVASTGAKGLAIATIADGKVQLVRAYGHRNAKGDPLTIDTVMYGASLTKAVFGYSVMQMVDEKRFGLDQSIASMLPKPLPEYTDTARYADYAPLKDDERWRKLTARILLTHSGGFANFGFLEPNGRLRIHFEPGSRYSYSGDGLILLQFALERGLGFSLGEEMQRRVFDRFGMSNTSMMWRPDFANNLADGWKVDGTVEPHDERSRVRSAGSMDTTISDFARFAAAYIRGDGLSAMARRDLTHPQLAITSRSQFPVLQAAGSSAEQVPHLAAGLGVVTFKGPRGPGFFKGGHNDWTANMWVCLERGRRCVVIMSNDVRAEPGFPEIVRTVLGETGLPWTWEYGHEPWAR